MKHLVIDTNIWLDLLVFEDPRADALRTGLAAGRYRAVGTDAMRAELAAVLARPQFRQDEARQAAALARWDALVERREEAPACNLSCRDPDDRKFLDLAVAHRVDWLLSKDRALLAARRFAQRRFGLNIGRLEQMLAAEAEALAKADAEAVAVAEAGIGAEAEALAVAGAGAEAGAAAMAGAEAGTGTGTRTGAAS